MHIGHIKKRFGEFDACRLGLKSKQTWQVHWMTTLGKNLQITNHPLYLKGTYFLPYESPKFCGTLLIVNTIGIRYLIHAPFGSLKVSVRIRKLFSDNSYGRVKSGKFKIYEQIRIYGMLLFTTPILFFFFKILFIYPWETLREVETQAQGEAGSLWRARCGTLHPRTLGSRPELKADAQSLCHPGVPHLYF